MSKTRKARPLADPEYRALAEFRYQLRKFLRYTEEQVRDVGVKPQQYQLMLAIKGLPLNTTPTISVLANRMQLNHNSMVELVDRCEERDLLSRVHSSADRRQVTLSITANGDALLGRLVSASRHELRNIGPILVESILRLILDRDGAQAETLAKVKRKQQAKASVSKNA